MTNNNPQAKLPVLNWHNQNPDVTTVEMSTVLPPKIGVPCPL